MTTPTQAQLNDFLGMGEIIRHQTQELERLRNEIIRLEKLNSERHNAQVERYVTLGNAMKMQTIERCAQVAHDWLKHHGYEIEAIECAAAIRIDCKGDCDKIEAATIERCAQVADRWRFFRVARLIAAAIRALKND